MNDRHYLRMFADPAPALTLLPSSPRRQEGAIIGRRYELRRIRTYTIGNIIYVYGW